LAHHLSFSFSIRLLDAESEALELECLAMLSSMAVLRNALPNHDPVCIFRGMFEKSTVSAAVQSVLYGTLDQAQSIEPPVVEADKDWCHLIEIGTFRETTEGN
jgi:hypothetical protein